MKPELIRNPRFQSLLLLERVAKRQAYSNLLLNDAIKKTQMDPKDARLFTEIVYGTISRQLTLDYYLTPFLKNARKLDEWVRLLLELSLYQMLYLDRVPTYGIINDAVEIAKNYGNPGIGKFVNGVLRNVDRQGVPDINDIWDKNERLSIELSLPLWLTEKLIQDHGYDQTRKIGLSLFEKSRVSARVTQPDKHSREELLNQLLNEGIEALPSTISPVGIVAEKGALAKSTVFQNGWLTIQDESSMLVAPTLLIQPSDKVLDACAAPGGKTTHIAQYLDANQGGEVIALDIHQHKLKLIEENAQRLGLTDCVVPTLLDAREVQNQFPDESFDCILVDAPCSGLGLMRRKPDIKYTKKATDFQNLQRIQLEILRSVATKVKIWGIITYSTCTFVPEENEQVIQQFLDEYPNFEVITPAGMDRLSESLIPQGLRLLPSDYGTDGFFISCLKRKN